MRNRTSSKVSDGWAGTVRSSRAANRGFFQNPPPPDGPRRPAVESRTLPAAHVHAPGSGTLAAGDAACPSRWPDTARPPAAATRAAPLRRRLRYSSVREDEAERTTSRTPSTDKAALGNAPALAAAAKSNHAEDGPRERQLPTVKSRQRSYPLRAGTPLSHYLRWIVPQSSLITPLGTFQPLHPLGSQPPRSCYARRGPLPPRNWPPVSPPPTG